MRVILGCEGTLQRALCVVVRLSTIDILLVADDADFLRSLSRYLRHFEGVAIRGMVSDPHDAIWLAKRLQPRVVIVDQGMLPTAELFVVERLRESLRQSCIIYVYQDEPHAAAARTLGAAASIPRAELLVELIPALHRVLRLPHSPRVRAERKRYRARPAQRTESDSMQRGG